MVNPEYNDSDWPPNEVVFPGRLSVDAGYLERIGFSTAPVPMGVDIIIDGPGQAEYDRREFTAKVAEPRPTIHCVDVDEWKVALAVLAICCQYEIRADYAHYLLQAALLGGGKSDETAP